LATRLCRQLVELSERKAHGSLIQCKGAKPNHCSGRSHELRSLYQKKKKRKTPGLRGTARVGMVG
jgi:cell fate regulator YaaT (PSP1 superfamily)